MRTKKMAPIHPGEMLGKYFGMAPQFWINLQSHYDLALEEDRIGARLSKEVHALAVAYA